MEIPVLLPTDEERQDKDAMTWFGVTWHAPVCAECEHVQPPVGELCLYCNFPIAATAQGLITWLVTGGAPVRRPTHLDCFLPRIGVAVDRYNRW